MALRRDLGSNLIALGVVKTRGVIQVVILSRLLGLSGYGIWVQAIAGASIVGMVSGLGLYQAVVQFYPRADDLGGRREVLFNALVPVVLTGLLVLILASLYVLVAPPFLPKPPATPAILLLGVMLGICYALRLVVMNVARARDELGRFAKQSATSELLELTAVVGGALLGRTVTASMAGALAGVGAMLLLLLWRERRDLAWAPSAVRMRRAFHYSLPLVPTQLGDELLARGDRLLVGGILGARAVGLYSVIYAFASLPQMVNIAMTTVLLPKLTTLQYVGTRAREVVRRSAMLYVGGALAVLVLVAFTLPFALTLVLGADSTHGGEPLRAVMIVIGLGVLCFGLGRLEALHLFVGERTRVVAAVWCTAAAINISMNLLLLPRIGLMGAAIATLASYALFLAGIRYVARVAQPAATAPPGPP